MTVIEGEEPTEDLSMHLRVARASSHGFFALVALLERLAPGAARVGGAGEPEEEAIRFRHDPALGFSNAEVNVPRIDKVQRADGERPAFEVLTSFFGLTGTVAPVPSYIAEEALEDNERGEARRDFLDLFHHRLISLLYRAVKKYDFAGDYASDAGDVWSKRVLSMTGLDEALASQLPTETILRLAPIFLSGGARSAEALAQALRDTLAGALGEGSLAIHQFVPSWVEIGDQDRTRLGLGNSTLSGGIVLGRRICDRASKVEIEIGPLAYAEYIRFLPSGRNHKLVRSVINALGQDGFDYDLELIIWCREIPELRLSRHSTQQLGRDTWLHGVGRKNETTVQVKVPLGGDRKV